MIKILDDAGEKIAFEIAKLLVTANISPMTVTIVRFLLAAPISLYFFSRGEYLYNIIGLVLYIALAVLDWVDGHMAQLYKLPKKTAAYGKLVDHNSDRLLMLIVLGSLIYAGLRGPFVQWWIPVAIAYYSAFFFITALMYEFDRTFQLDIHTYPQIEKHMSSLNNAPSFADRVLYNILYVHNNSFTRIFLNHNLLLIAGVLTNQLLILFLYFALMHTVRSIGVFVVMYKTLHMKPTASVLAKALRKYIRPS